MTKRLGLSAVLAVVMLIGAFSAAMAAHPDGNWTAAQINKILNAGAYWDGSGSPTEGSTPVEIILKDVSGNPITTLLNAKGYSPKQTCGQCHQYENAGGISGTSISKNSVLDGVTHNYTVKAATAGVSSGYHFSQGLNEPWGAAERGYYGMPSFTSSPGMLGKF